MCESIYADADADDIDIWEDVTIISHTEAEWEDVHKPTLVQKITESVSTHARDAVKRTLYAVPSRVASSVGGYIAKIVILHILLVNSGTLLVYTPTMYRIIRALL